MHILYASYTRFPSERAHAIQIAHMGNAFVECGHQVTLLTTSRQNQVTRSFKEYFGVEQLFAHKTVWVPEWSVLAGFLYKCWQLYFAFQCVRFIKQQQPDLVYSRDEWTLYVISFFVSADRLVWESHEGKYNWATKRLRRLSLPWVVISEGIYEHYRDLGILESKLVLAPDAIDDHFLQTTTTQSDAQTQLEINGERPVVLYIGGLEKWKGVDTLCQAADTLGTDAAVYVVGGNKEQVAAYRAKYPHVTFLGFYPYAELPTIQRAADVLIIPNTAARKLSSHFTSPLKLYAYMSSGVPTVASDIPSLRSVLGDDMCTYFTPDDPTALREAIRTVLEDAATAKENALRAQAYVKDKTWSNRAKLILKSVMVE